MHVSDTTKSQYQGFIEKNFIPEVGLKMGSLAEQFRQEGKQKGRQEGRQEGIKTEKIAVAQRLLTVGCEVEFIAKITGLLADQICKLKSKHKK